MCLNKMKICHITSVHPRTDGRIFKRECVTLANNGNEVVLVCCDGKSDEIVDGVRIISYSRKRLTKSRRGLLMFFNRGFLKYLKEIDADVYQFHDFDLIEIGRKLAKTKKVIYDSHENWFGMLTNKFSMNITFLKRIITRVLGCYYKKVLPVFSAVFTVSPNIVDNLKQYTPNVYMIPNFPAIEKFDNKNLSDGGKELAFIYQGTVYSMSNQEYIIKAINEFASEVRYKIIGKISLSLKSRLEKLNCKSRVIFKNWLKKEELQNEISGSIAGLAVLDYSPVCCGREGQLGSNKIFEYMLLGIPIICTDFTLWKNLIVDKYQCGICVPPHDSKAIYNAMKYIIDHPEEAVKMGERGRMAVMEEFNWGKYEQTFLKIYLDIFNGKK